MDDLVKAIIQFPANLFWTLVGLIIAILTDIEMLALAGGAGLLTFVFDPLVVLGGILLLYGSMRAYANIMNEQSAQINFLARVIRDNRQVSIESIPTVKLEADEPKRDIQD